MIESGEKHPLSSKQWFINHLRSFVKYLFPILVCFSVAELSSVSCHSLLLSLGWWSLWFFCLSGCRGGRFRLLFCAFTFGFVVVMLNGLIWFAGKKVVFFFFLVFFRDNKIKNSQMSQLCLIVMVITVNNNIKV